MKTGTIGGMSGKNKKEILVFGGVTSMFLVSDTDAHGTEVPTEPLSFPHTIHIRHSHGSSTNLPHLIHFALLIIGLILAFVVAIQEERKRRKN